MTQSAGPLGLYPGSFDPPTLGHIDVIRRSLRVVDQLRVAVAVNEAKKALFNAEERVELLNRVLDEELDPQQRTRVTVERFDGLVALHAQRIGAGVLIRGLRYVSDFEFELQMASMNRRLAPDVETILLTTDERTSYISSRMVKEVAALGGDVTAAVPERVAAALTKKLSRPKS